MIADHTINMRTRSENNMREHHMVRARRRKNQRHCVRAVLGELEAEGPLVVHLARIAPRDLDDDNLQGALKAVRDEVAACLGRDDSPRSGIQWTYSQARGAKGQFAVRIQITKAEEVAA